MNIYLKHGCDCIFECIFLQACTAVGTDLLIIGYDG